MNRLDPIAGSWPAIIKKVSKRKVYFVSSESACLFFTNAGNTLSVLLLLLLNFTCLTAVGHAEEVFLKEDFNSLENWRPLYFPKIKQHSTYTIIREGDRSFLKAQSNASASGIIYKKEFNVYDYPRLRWSWRIENVYKKGDEQKKSGDDYPIRIYVLFKYDPEKASFGQRIRFGFVKALYGEYPPQSSINYIWANRGHKEKIITNAYVSEAKMIIMEAGMERAGQWITEEVDIIEDYKKAFGVSPPPVAGLAIMNDSDDTGESSVSYVGFIEVYK